MAGRFALPKIVNSNALFACNCSAYPHTIRFMDNILVITAMRAFGGRNSQKTLAVELGISEQYLSDIINEKRDVTEEIAKFFGYERVWRKIK